MSSVSGTGLTPVQVNPSEFPNPLGYNPFPDTLQPYIAAVLFETFLYGIYCVLYVICLYILIRGRQFLHWLLPVLASLMFSVATADICYTMYLLYHRLLEGALTFRDMRPKYWLYVTNNVLADSMLLYRCYIVWGGDAKIMLLPVLLFVASMVCGYLFEGSTSILFAQSWIYVLLTFILNMILTGLIAGRIGWLSWKGKKLLDRRLRKRYYVALAAILESGLLTSIYMLPDLILVNIILDNGFVQVVGIMPTLIVVQIGLGHAVKLVDPSGEETIEPIVIAPLTISQEEGISNTNHVMSFYSDKHTETARPKGEDFRLTSLLDHRDQLRTREERITIEDDPRALEEKPLKPDMGQES